MPPNTTKPFFQGRKAGKVEQWVLWIKRHTSYFGKHSEDSRYLESDEAESPAQIPATGRTHARPDLPPQLNELDIQSGVSSSSEENEEWEHLSRLMDQGFGGEQRNNEAESSPVLPNDIPVTGDAQDTQRPHDLVRTHIANSPIVDGIESRSSISTVKDIHNETSVHTTGTLAASPTSQQQHSSFVQIPVDQIRLISSFGHIEAPNDQQHIRGLAPSLSSRNETPATSRASDDQSPVEPMYTPEGRGSLEDQNRGSRPDAAPYSQNDLILPNEARTELASTMKEVLRTRAKVNYENIGMSEQAQFVLFKLDEVKVALTTLQNEQGADLPLYAQALQRTELKAVVEESMARLTIEVRTLEQLQNTLTRLEQKLMKEERQILALLGQPEAPEGDNGLEELEDPIRHVVRPVADHNSPVGSDNGSFQDFPRHPPIRIMTRPARRSSRSTLHSAIEVRSATENSLNSRRRHPLPSPGSVQRFEFNDPEDDSALANTLPSDDVCVGYQFEISDDELENITRDDQNIPDFDLYISNTSEVIASDEFETADNDLYIQKKRERDLLSIAELWPYVTANEAPTLDHEVDPRIPGLSPGHMISHWILQFFATSWLELKRYIRTTGRLTPLIDEVVISFGYIHLSSLIYANWFCDNAAAHPQGVISHYPSISSASNDVPLYFHQIYIADSDAGSARAEHFQMQLLNTLPMSNEIQQSSNRAQPVHSDRSSGLQSVSTKSSKAPSQIWDHPRKPRKSDTFPTDYGSIRALPRTNCNTNVF